MTQLKKNKKTSLTEQNLVQASSKPATLDGASFKTPANKETEFKNNLTEVKKSLDLNPNIKIKAENSNLSENIKNPKNPKADGSLETENIKNKTAELSSSKSLGSEEEAKISSSNKLKARRIVKIILVVNVFILVFSFVFLASPFLWANKTNNSYNKINLKTVESSPQDQTQSTKLRSSSDSLQDDIANLKNKISNFGLEIDTLNQKILDDIITREEIFVEQKNSSDLKDVDFAILRAKTIEILGENAENHAIYVYDLKRKQGFSYRAREDMFPASISKLPAAMLTMKAIDEGTYTLNTLVTIQNHLKNGERYPMYNYPAGSQYPLREYMYRLLVNSDNTAMLHLENLHGGLDSYNQKISKELGLSKFSRQPHVVTAENIGLYFEDIYYSKTLSKSSNEYLKQLLSTDNVWNSDRLQLALNSYPIVNLVHKIGNLPTAKGNTYQDSGIVYGETTDFVIVILNKDLTVSQNITYIIKITQLVYEELNY